jgi:formate dehydrogenase subunit delta
MDVQHLIKMANNIGAFFEAEPDKAKAAKGVADHIRNFWEPRMIRGIFEHIDGGGGAGLTSIVLSALRTHRQELGG